MINWKKIFATLLMPVLLGTAFADDHTHDAPIKLMLNNGKKWTTDENLRHGMSSIRNILATELNAIHSGRETAEQYRALAQKTSEQITFITKNCKLEPKADAMLHPLLADIILATEIMTGNDAHQGAAKIAHALENYATYFEHPGWHGLEPAH